jgi:IS5 family transposase
MRRWQNGRKSSISYDREFGKKYDGNVVLYKRVFGISKAIWKGVDGFKAFVWSSVISNNLVRLARVDSG